MSENMKISQLARIVGAMPTKRYLYYIRSPQWSRRRNEHLSMCGWICEICRIRKACQVHHWTYKRLGLYGLISSDQEEMHFILGPSLGLFGNLGHAVQCVEH